MDRMAYLKPVCWLLAVTMIADGLSSERDFRSKILVTAPSVTCSHLFSSAEIARTLSARGNDVWFLIDEELYDRHAATLALPEQMKVAFYKTALSYTESETYVRRYVSKQLRDSSANTAKQYRLEAEDREIQERLGGRKVDLFTATSVGTDDILGIEELMRGLKAAGFDMIVGDYTAQFYVILSQVLQVPYIHIGLTPIAPSQHDRPAYTPSHPAYVPERFSAVSDTMTIRERLKNYLLYWVMSYSYDKYVLTPYDKLLQKRNIRPDANFFQLLTEAKLWIFNSDFVVDFPRPLNPQVKFVGGFLAGSAKPLNQEWQSFVDGAGEHGIVIMALGTLISDELTDQQAESIASSLALLSQKVAWSYSGKLPKTLGNNTKVVKWLPQNDLLGHPKTRAFISHGGLNSIHQCIYHAVPMVGIPVFGDQKDNFIRLGAKGMSVLLDIHQLTERSIYDATVEIIYNETYKEAVQRYSAIARDRVTPMTALEEVAYWVEYAVRHGTDHLKPRAMQLSFVQYYLLDVIAITVVIVTIMCWCVVNVGRCLFRGFTPPVVRVPGIPVS
ncbi:UDP-glucuronosyltransferase 2C1-like isoform X1 [Acanthaster planci]|uniref:UDP-glucuronosyltransferase 2C1-like isoform X1 n=1 Tax=Acanthaster planci TaxID=133434 RepID=A0A8B7Z110_ACAPL|nr:UDP-glucuronosyltransferase 2C1-like isoform X1 [Acanthaster planci]